jgi:hypothetical protein
MRKTTNFESLPKERECLAETLLEENQLRTTFETSVEAEAVSNRYDVGRDTTNCFRV